MKKFLHDESGAVTVDFVVLSGGAVLIAVGVGPALNTKVTGAVSALTVAGAAT
jgi:Flp pilus assembly pilin Flp